MNMLEEKVVAVIANHFGISVEKLTLETTLKSLGADHLDAVEIAVILEEDFFPLLIPDGQLPTEKSTVADVVKLVKDYFDEMERLKEEDKQRNTMNEEQAFQFLEKLVGHPLPLNGVHGKDLKTIAELYKVKSDMNDNLLDTIHASAFFQKATALNVSPDSIVLVEGTNFSESTLPAFASHLKSLLGVRGVIIKNPDEDFTAMEREQVLALVRSLLKAYPGMYEELHG